MEKKILKAIEEAYRKGLKDAEGLNDISPYLLTSQVVAQELANKFCQTLVGGAKRKLVCPHCKSGEENFTRNGNHIWCRKCDYEFNVG